MLAVHLPACLPGWRGMAPAWHCSGGALSKSWGVTPCPALPPPPPLCRYPGEEPARAVVSLEGAAVVESVAPLASSIKGVKALQQAGKCGYCCAPLLPLGLPAQRCLCVSLAPIPHPGLLKPVPASSRPDHPLTLQAPAA